ncbi:MAG: DNA primase [Patescibacteria group bacterium]
MSSQVDQIKARLSITDIVGSYIKLEKAGGNWKARCPFHNEKTPSFFVSPSRDSFHCFGCNQGGDIFTFVQEIEGLDFLGALEVLAARAGVELKPIDFGLKSAKEKLYAIVEEASKFYMTQLAASPEALAYLSKRGITDETKSRFYLGLAPLDWQSLLNHLINQGYRAEDIEKTGLTIKTASSIKHPQGRYYDRFRGRLMFPLADVSGRAIGFSGRLLARQNFEGQNLGGLAVGDQAQAKYINSPQTELYDKSRALYGYDKARVEIKRQNHCVLVEGQIDLVLSHQAGVANAVAVSGTALTENHLLLIKRLTENLIMAFDADLAGVSASRRAFELALGLGMEVKIALLPDGLDPADVVVKNPAAWKIALAEAKNIIDFYLEVIRRQNYDVRTTKLKVTAEVLPYVAKLTNAIDQAHFVAKIGNFLGIKEEPIWEELKKVKAHDLGEETIPYETTIAARPAKPRREIIAEKIFGLISWQESLTKPDFNIADYKNKWQEFLHKSDGGEQEAKLKLVKDRLILEAELVYGGNEFIAREAEELLSNWREESLREELQELMTKIRDLEIKGETVSGSPEQAAQLDGYLKKCQALSQELNNLR